MTKLIRAALISTAFEVSLASTIVGYAVVVPQYLIRADSCGSENCIMIAGDASASHISCLFRPEPVSVGGYNRG